jgi:hypothetical protein
MIEILSLGAGVQSSTMALMAAEGLITPMPTCGIFADTQAEPASVYKWLDWLEAQLPFPIHRVTKGDLTESSLRVRTSATGTKYAKHSIPAFIVDKQGKKGLLMRQCTLDFKIQMIIRKIKLITGKKKKCIQWIGISKDEATRMKDSREPYITNRWPLIEMEMTRAQCLQWMKDKGYPTPPRSSCVYCPYHSDKEWMRLKTDEPEEFQKAIEYERRLQKTMTEVTGFRGIPYLHSSRINLELVDLRPKQNPQRELNFFENECEGMCGV